jgi:hypothetical protein
LAHLAGCSSGGLPEPADGLAARLSEPLAETTEPLPDPAEGLAGRIAELPDRAARPEGLSSGVGQSAERLAGRTSRLHGTLSRLSDVSERLADSSAWPKRLLPELADAPDRVVHGLDEAFQNFRVAVEGGQRPIEDVVQVLESHLQLRFGLHPLDVHLDLAEGDVHTCDDLEQVRELCTQRQMRLELLDVDVDLVDFDLADVDVDVRVVTGLTALEVR